MIAKIELLRRGIHSLSEVPVAFDGLRWILEGGFRKHRQLIERSIEKKASRVLDCGCGTGIYARCFHPAEYFGIDISAAYIARASRMNPGYQFEVMDASSMRFDDSCFDTVIVSGVLHHLDDAASYRVLSEIHRVLKPQGELLLWEDVPTRSRWNIVGSLVHQLDVGDHIREEQAYAAMLPPLFEIKRVESFRSGFMDYIALKSQKLAEVSAKSNSTYSTVQPAAPHFSVPMPTAMNAAQPSVPME